MQSEVLVLCLLVSACALPSINREGAADGGVREDAGRDSGAVDAGDPAENPRLDPANNNEDLEAFRAKLPSENVWAKWPMPDAAEGSKFKPSYTVSDKVIVDDVTKLTWQRVMPTVYPDCQAEYEFVGRKRGPGSGCDWEEAQAYCARPELAEELGPGSWRLPTKIELESLIDATRLNTIDPLFDDFPIERVWTSSPIPNPDGLKLAWAVDFMEGTSVDSARFQGGRVRCVSSSASQLGGLTPDYWVDNEVVRDDGTKLQWQRYPDTTPRSFVDASAYCEGLSILGSGWRLPTLKEMLTLVDPSVREPAIHQRAFEKTQSERYWTATEFLDLRDAHYKVEFLLGGTVIDGVSAELYYVRCVRSL
jgi:hypothetical protein